MLPAAMVTAGDFGVCVLVDEKSAAMTEERERERERKRTKESEKERR